MVLKPVLTVEGKEYEVRSLSFDDGVVKDATVMDEHKKIVDYYSIDCKYSFVEQHMKVDFSTALKFVDDEAISKEDGLFAHLDEVYLEEQQKLTEIAIDAMEDELIEPFATNLAERQKEYKLMKQRLLGMLDAIEEVKAYTEGYYANGNDAEVEA